MGKIMSEVKAIQELRDKYRTMPQMTLARKIYHRDFTSKDDLNVVGAIIGRPRLSIYSVIRRYDAAQNKAAITQAA